MDLAKLIESLKDFTVKRILLLSAIGIISLVIWKIEPILTYMTNRPPKHVETAPKTVEKLPAIIYDSDTDILSVAKVDTDKLFKAVSGVVTNTNLPVASVAIYKFVPGSIPHEYQGRVLVFYWNKQIGDNREQAEAKIEEINLRWLPIWSGKDTIEELLDGHTTKSKLVGQEFVFTDSQGQQEVDNIPSINQDSMILDGVKGIYRQPIKRNAHIVGYISIFLTDDNVPEADLQKYAGLISAKTARMLDDKYEDN